MPTYDCDKHASQRALASYCPECMDAFAHRRDPDSMTGDERAAELRWWVEVLTIPISDLHQRIEELVGRAVWTHEMGTSGIGRLIEEARTREHPTPQEIIDRIPPEKRIVVVTDE